MQINLEKNLIDVILIWQ